ncbi:hypothetical protein EAS56_00925 [Bradyrhizobium guangzhouense]|uniref:Uncharacterized protein n=1 Tax=Bradyrhizobium guangzhouense TaxID=1325095 RepID=A0ABY0ED68_9BRAD|nr:hypothetical protein EAS56_00925 [Bradyrhizobium guangzhouense]
MKVSTVSAQKMYSASCFTFQGLRSRFDRRDDVPDDLVLHGEDDLFGDEYRRRKQRVSMLIPWRKSV